jgi:hypothetical protein
VVTVIQVHHTVVAVVEAQAALANRLVRQLLDLHELRVAQEPHIQLQVPAEYMLAAVLDQLELKV